MYIDGETLLIAKDIGVKGTKNFLAADTQVTFIKLMESKADISKAMVVVTYNDVTYCLPEVAVKKPDQKFYDKAIREFNNSMIKQNPDLGIYHHNYFVRLYHKIRLFFKKRKKRADDLSNLKKLINEQK